MKRSSRCLIAVAAGSCALIALMAALPSQAVRDAADDDIFQSTNLPHITVEIPAEGVQQLRNSQSGFQRRQNPQMRPQVRARVLEGDRVYTNVAVQVKGTSSFRPIDSAPSLTLNFDKFAPNQKFHGLTKISLNNSAQDPTRLHEKFSRELFEAAGVPVARADHAFVTLNGRMLGLYVLTEGYSQPFLKRYFKRTDGNLYEGGVLQDIDGPMQVSLGKNPTNHAGLRRLIAAARVPEQEERFHALENILDLDRFLSMVAMEAILCHSDSYSMNRNNYRVYHDPSTDKMVFIPHGMDRVLGTHRSSLDLAVVPPMLGLVARATISTPEGRRRYIERAEVLFTNLFQPERLCRRVREIDAKMAGELLEDPLSHRFSQAFARNHLQFAEDLCSRISTRARNLEAQFAEAAENLLAAPIPRFDEDGVAHLDNWKPRPMNGRPGLLFEMADRGGKRVVRLGVPEGAGVVSLRCRVSLPAGTYRFTGGIELATPNKDAPRNPVFGRVFRQTSGRFGSDAQPVVWSDAKFGFEVPAARAPEEIEFVCDIRAGPGEVWFDASSLRLVRRDR